MLAATQLAGLPLARYEFVLQTQAAALWPPFLGTALRGAFGHALKAISCVMPHQDCRRCLLAARCRYPNLFETPPGPHHALLRHAKDAPRPFLFEPALPAAPPTKPDAWLATRVPLAAGENVCFGLTLCGEAVAEMPYFIRAVQVMAQQGLGAERTACHLGQVVAHGENGWRTVIYTPEADFLTPHLAPELSVWVAARLTQLAFIKDRLRVRLATPLRLRVRGSLAVQLDFAQLVNALSLRLALVYATHGAALLEYDYHKLLDQARQVETVRADLQLQHLQRRTNRQATTLNLDGLMGEIEFAGPNLHDFLPLLVAGELLHLGSGTAFGLGRLCLLPPTP